MRKRKRIMGVFLIIGVLLISSMEAAKVIVCPVDSRTKSVIADIDDPRPKGIHTYPYSHKNKYGEINGKNIKINSIG